VVAARREEIQEFARRGQIEQNRNINIFLFGEHSNNVANGNEPRRHEGVELQPLRNSKLHRWNTDICQQIGMRIIEQRREVDLGFIVQSMEGRRLEIELNRSNGTKSWSVGKDSTSTRAGHKLQVISEIFTEGTYYSVGSNRRERF
jgi:hypothetical protein